jgi:hypothetical protein
MARIPTDELMSRAQIEALYKAYSDDDGLTEVDALEQMREQALAEFTRQLDAKIANLQRGEYLSVVFRVDIIRANGKVRGGSGSQRNMPEYIEWRKQVFERDGYKCQECGAGGKLAAHHIKPWSSYPDLRFDVDNGKTLCSECHAKEHPHLKMI